MSPEKQRIAIAEIVGWKPFKFQHDAKQCWEKDDGNVAKIDQLPDYLNDLNAMHDAEKSFIFSKGADYSRWERYDNHLFKICGAFARAHASADQRAEAFLRVFGKWEESES